MSKLFALDLETHWSKELTVTEMGAHGYFNALSLEQIYMVSVYAEDGRAWAGHPSDLDWSFMEGSTILVWNAGFETQGLRRLRELGIPIPTNFELVDVADMACYVGLPRALKGAAEASLGVKIDKGIRDTEMKGKRWVDMAPEFQERVREYAINDTKYTMELWQKHNAAWPANERLVSRLSCEWAAEGIGADVEAMQEAQKTLKQVIWEAGTKLPWFNPDDPKSVPLSHKMLALQCRDAGIPCPKSLAMDDEDCAAWEDQYGEQYPWVGAMRDYRRANALLKKVQAMERRTFDGRLRFEVKYFGAGMTGRWSGSAGVNMQNLSGKLLYGVNCRDLIVAPEGKTFVVSDLSQIEPRVLLWLVKDTEQLGIIASGVSPYVAHARAAMGVPATQELEKSDQTYKLAKARILALGYNCGHHKFIVMAADLGMPDLFDYPAPKEHTAAYEAYLKKLGNKEWLTLYNEGDAQTKNRLVNSFVVVQDYRAGSPKIVGLWNQFKEALNDSASRGQDLDVLLPSGRTISYKKCRYRRTKKDGVTQSEVVSDILRGGRPQTSRLYGGLVTENCLGGSAEILTPEGWVRLDQLPADSLVWDGEEFVQHGGIINKGVQPTASLMGINTTLDHLFMTDSGWSSAKKVLQDRCFSPYYTHGNKTHPQAHPSAPRLQGFDREKERDINGGLPLRAEEQPELLIVECYMHLREPQADDIFRLEKGPLLLKEVPSTKSPPKHDPGEPQYVQAPGVCGVGLNESPLPAEDPLCLPQLRGAGDNRLRAVAGEPRELLGGYGASIQTGADAGAGEQQRRVFPGELPLGHSVSTSPEYPSRANTGVGSGFSEGKRREVQHLVLPPRAGGGLQDRRDSSEGYEEVLQPQEMHLGDQARANPRTNSFCGEPRDWEKSNTIPHLGGVESGRFLETTEIGGHGDKNIEVPEHPTRETGSPDGYLETGKSLGINQDRLRAANTQRSAVGSRPEIHLQPMEVYDILNCGPRHRFAVRIPGTESCVIAHNCTQGMARDVFRDCLIRLHEHGYKVALHVHDEAVVEVPEAEAEFHRERIEQLMSVTPSWAPGLPVAAEAKIAKKYSEGK